MKKNEKKTSSDPRPAYVPPQVSKLDDMHAGAGYGCVPGSGGSLNCSNSGSNATNCIGSGSSADNSIG